MRFSAPWTALFLFLLLLTAYVGVDLYSDYVSIGAAERERLSRRTEIINANLSRQLQTTGDALRVIGDEFIRTPGLQAAPKNENPLLERYVSMMTGVRTLIIVNAAGLSVASSSKALVGLDFSDGERFSRISKGADPAAIYLSPPFQTPLGNYAMSLGKVLLDSEGRFNGYILAILDPEYFGILLKSLIYAPDMRLGVVHADGKVVYRVPDEEHVIGQDLGRDQGSVFGRHVGSGQVSSFHEGSTAVFSNTRMVSYRTVQPATSVADRSLMVFAGRDRQAVFEAWSKELAYRAGLILIIAVIGFFWVLTFQRRQRAFDRLRTEQAAERDRADQEIRQLNVDLEHKVTERTAALTDANRKLERLSRQDALTGLPNRLAVNERLHAEFTRLKRSGHSYAVMVIDIDRFKQFNDTHGHAVGDQVLQRVAGALAGSIRDSDFVARYGGEEFFALLPETALAGAGLVAEKLRQTVESLRDTGSGPVTISVGVAVATADDRDEDFAVREADAMLYAAKASGRNCVRLSAAAQ